MGIQSFYTDYRWMKGAFDKGSRGANLRDIYDGDELDEGVKFQWILRKDKGLGHTDVGIECLPTASSGVWNYLATATGGDYTLTYTEGVTRTNERSTDRTSTWDTSVSASVTANFAFGSVSGEVTQSFGGSQSTTVSNSLARNQDVSHATTWYEKGVIWQYAIHIQDLCVPGWDVTTNEVYMTPSIEEPPCCLPGYFLDIENPHGPCKEGSPCQCSKEVCEGPQDSDEDTSDSNEEEEEGGDSEEEEEGETSEDKATTKTTKKGAGGKKTTTKKGGYDGANDDYYDDDYLMGYDDDYMYSTGDDYMYSTGGGDDYYGDYGDDYYGHYDDDYSSSYGRGGGAGGGAGGGSGGLLGSNNGGQPLISLNINQANNNNNGAGFPATPNPPPAGGGDDGYPPRPSDDDDDFSLGSDDDDAAANTDDYLDIVLDALKDVGETYDDNSSDSESSFDDLRRERKLRGVGGPTEAEKKTN